jgi:hypothetical protein
MCCIVRTIGTFEGTPTELPLDMELIEAAMEGDVAAMAAAQQAGAAVGFQVCCPLGAL